MLACVLELMSLDYLYTALFSAWYVTHNSANGISAVTHTFLSSLTTPFDMSVVYCFCFKETLM